MNKPREFWIFNPFGGLTQVVYSRPKDNPEKWEHVIEYSAYEAEQLRVKHWQEVARLNCLPSKK